jgi:UDP-2,3-diacylglucosamine hydrolase
MTTLFISDLHLTAERPAITELFLRFLRDEAAHAQALYILGDLFEYWIGDEAGAAAENAPVIAGLRALTDAGVPVHFMQGNRDFLVGGGFANATGCTLLPEAVVIDLHGRPTLLMHGDTLCTDDTEYQRFRQFIRDPALVREFLSKTIPERLAMVRGYRQMSKMATSSKAAEIMDVNGDTVVATLRAHGVHRLIHGHTHRPAKHEITVDGQPAERIVLGDWYEQGSVLRCDSRDCTLAGLTS